MGKSKNTVALRKRIVANLTSGCTRKSACLAAGISEESFYQYMKDPEFEQLILQTEESVIVANCAIIRRAAPKEWRAAAWLLERRRPDDYKLRQALDVTDLKDEQLLRLLERTAEAGSDQAGTDPGTESNQSTAESNPS